MSVGIQLMINFHFTLERVVSQRVSQPEKVKGVAADPLQAAGQQLTLPCS